MIFFGPTEKTNKTKESIKALKKAFDDLPFGYSKNETQFRKLIDASIMTFLFIDGS